MWWKRNNYSVVGNRHKNKNLILQPLLLSIKQKVNARVCSISSNPTVIEKYCSMGSATLYYRPPFILQFLVYFAPKAVSGTQTGSFWQKATCWQYSLERAYDYSVFPVARAKTQACIWHHLQSEMVFASRDWRGKFQFILLQSSALYHLK